MRCELVKTALGVHVLGCLEHTFTGHTLISVCPSPVSENPAVSGESQTFPDRVCELPVGLHNSVIARIIQETVRHSHAYGAPSAGNPSFLQGLVNAVWPRRFALTTMSLYFLRSS
jgi:hypothetical protein